jgi:hypothetical protein
MASCKWLVFVVCHCLTSALPDREPQFYESALAWLPGTGSACGSPDTLPVADPSSHRGEAGLPSRRIWLGPLELLNLAQECPDCWRCLRRPDAEGKRLGSAMDGTARGAKAAATPLRVRA